MSDERDRDWRGINVRRSRKYEHLVDKLCNRRDSVLGKPLFEFNKDLMVFAAMVGHTLGRFEPVDTKNSIQIVLGTYATDEKDGFIYLLGLLKTQGVECLKDANLEEAVRAFEGYCNGGLSVIDEWFAEAADDLDGVNTLVRKIQEQLVGDEEDHAGSGLRVPDF